MKSRKKRPQTPLDVDYALATAHQGQQHTLEPLSFGPHVVIDPRKPGHEVVTPEIPNLPMRTALERLIPSKRGPGDGIWAAALYARSPIGPEPDRGYHPFTAAEISETIRAANRTRYLTAQGLEASERIADTRPVIECPKW